MTSEKSWNEFPKLFKAINTWPTEKERVIIARFRNGHVTRPMPVKAWRWWKFAGQNQPLPTDIVAWREV